MLLGFLGPLGYSAGPHNPTEVGDRYLISCHKKEDKSRDVLCCHDVGVRIVTYVRDGVQFSVSPLYLNLLICDFYFIFIFFMFIHF